MAANGNESESPRFRVGVFAVIERLGEYLLALRRDIHWWNLPGGGLEYDETLEEGLRREVREETGCEIEIERLAGVYSKPQKREIVLTFLCHLTDTSPSPGTSDEVEQVAWFAPDSLPEHVLPKHRERLQDAIAHSPTAVLRDQRSSTAHDQGLF